MKLILIVAGIFAAGFCWMIYEILTAPSGDEDEDGFHYTDKD